MGQNELGVLILEMGEPMVVALRCFLTFSSKVLLTLEFFLRICLLLICVYALLATM